MSEMKVRAATIDDLPVIVELLAGDELGKQRELLQDPLPASYYLAFERIEKDDNQELLVLEDDNGEILGTLQLSFLQYLTYRGGLRAQIEAVRVRKDQRGKGFGEKMIKWAIERARSKKAHLVQLTTDKYRLEALAFYEDLGFRATHEGMKLHFNETN